MFWVGAKFEEVSAGSSVPTTLTQWEQLRYIQEVSDCLKGSDSSKARLRQHVSSIHPFTGVCVCVCVCIHIHIFGQFRITNYLNPTNYVSLRWGMETELTQVRGKHFQVWGSGVSHHVTVLPWWWLRNHRQKKTSPTLLHRNGFWFISIYLHVLVHYEYWYIKSCEGDEYDAVEINETTITNVPATKQQDKWTQGFRQLELMCCLSRLNTTGLFIKSHSESWSKTRQQGKFHILTSLSRIDYTLLFAKWSMETFLW